MHSTGGSGGGGIRVEVEVRRRNQPATPALDWGSPPTAEAKESVSTSPSRAKHPWLIQEAYSDDRFDSPTRFFTAAPDHPKLGKWAQPSTLKHVPATTNNTNTHTDKSHVDGGATPARQQAVRFTVANVPSFATHTPNPRQNPYERNAGKRGMGPGETACRSAFVSSREANGMSKPTGATPCTRSMSAKPGSRAHSPPTRFGHHRSTHSQPQQQPPQQPQNQLAVTQRIDTPISGRVVRLHPRSQQQQNLSLRASPSFLSLCGSFDASRQIGTEQQQPQQPLVRLSPLGNKGPGTTGSALEEFESRSWFPDANEGCRTDYREGTGYAAVTQVTQDGGAGARDPKTFSVSNSHTTVIPQVYCFSQEQQGVPCCQTFVTGGTYAAKLHAPS